MKHIKKGKEPNSLTQYRQQQDAYYDGYPQKDDLRDSLLKEQRYICCYCMQRISKEKMRIEHWKSQTKYPAQQLIYTNLLGACTGNEGQPKHLQHCDVSKGNACLKKINPTVSNCESLVKFKSNGEIYSDDADTNNDLTVTLNLNYQTIKNNRGTALDTAYKKLGIHKGTWTNDLLQRELAKWKGDYDEKYEPYCQIVIYHLKKRLAKP